MMPLQGPKANDDLLSKFEKIAIQPMDVFCIHSETSSFKTDDELTKTHTESSPSLDNNEPTNYGYLRNTVPCKIIYNEREYLSVVDVWNHYYSTIDSTSNLKDIFEFVIKIINYRWLNDSGFRNVLNLKSPTEISTCNHYIYESDQNDTLFISSTLQKQLPQLPKYPILGLNFLECNRDNIPFLPFGLNFTGIAITIIVNYYRKYPQPDKQLTENNCIEVLNDQINNVFQINGDINNVDPFSFGTNTLYRILI